MARRPLATTRAPFTLANFRAAFDRGDLSACLDYAQDLQIMVSNATAPDERFIGRIEIILGLDVDNDGLPERIDDICVQIGELIEDFEREADDPPEPTARASSPLYAARQALRAIEAERGELPGAEEFDTDDDFEEKEITLAEVISLLDNYDSMIVLSILRRKYEPLRVQIDSVVSQRVAYRRMLVDACTMLQANSIPMPETVKEFWEDHEQEAMAEYAKQRLELEEQVAKGNAARAKLNDLILSKEGPAMATGKVARRIIIRRGRQKQ